MCRYYNCAFTDKQAMPLKYFTAFKCFFFSLLVLHSFTVWSQETPETEAATSTESTPSESPDNKTAEEDSSDKTDTDNAKTKNPRASIKIIEPVNIYQQTQSDIKHYLPNKGIEPLSAGPDDYLILLEESHTALNKGVAILIPDFPIGATTPKSINHLRKKLPEEGWTTITIQPSYSPVDYPSKHIDEKLRLKENADALMGYQAKLRQLIPAVMEKAKTYPGLFLVIAEGTHAAMLTNIYHQDAENIPSALVMLSAYLPTEIEGHTFAKNMAELETPILDLYLKHDHPLVINNSKIRKKLAQKELKVYYRQQQLSNFSSSYYPLEQLMKAINGWLKITGW